MGRAASALVHFEDTTFKKNKIKYPLSTVAAALLCLSSQHHTWVSTEHLPFHWKRTYSGGMQG